MGQTLFLIMMILCLDAYSQTGEARVFKTMEYINGDFYRTQFDTIVSKNERIDIYFFKRHFYTPYYIPDRFVDKKLKNKTIRIWANKKGKKDHKLNWEETYKYNSLGLVTTYGYSSCFVCSQLPYNYKVTYNSSNQIKSIIETDNNIESFYFFYNVQGEIIQFDKYILRKLATRTTLLN